MKQPFVIRILAWFAAFGSAAMCLSIPLVAWGIVSPRMGGELVTRIEWLKIAAPLVAAIGILMALSSYALARRRHWARQIVLTIPLLILVYAIGIGQFGLVKPIIMWRAIINATILGSASAWYFYLKPNVVNYFLQLAKAT